MRIIIDTDREQIIVPDTFYQTIDKKNDVLKKAGVTDKKIDYEEYVRENFEKAMEGPWIRKSDLAKKKQYGNKSYTTGNRLVPQIVCGVS